LQLCDASLDALSLDRAEVKALAMLALGLAYQLYESLEL
jgi:hypothetical protein